MRTFKETLDFARKHKINPYNLLVADDVLTCIADKYKNYSDEEYEKLCRIVKEIYVDNEGLEPYEICDKIIDLGYPNIDKEDYWKLHF